MPPATSPAAPTPGKLTTDPDLNPKPPVKLLDIDWEHTSVATEADALALWQRIAPTGEDWEEKLDEVPEDERIPSALALALFHGGNFTCVTPPPPRDCGPVVPIDIEPPLATATFDDPCLRRVLAMWSMAELDDSELPAAMDALRAIVAIPPPESQLVATVLDLLPPTASRARLELLAIAFAAGHRELVNGKLGDLDEPSLIEAATKHHIDGALDQLTAETHRAVFDAAVADEAMIASARTQAMAELVASVASEGPKLPPDVRRVLLRAAKSADCTVAAAAVRLLVQHGETKVAPARPRTTSVPTLMRATCVLASYEQRQDADEASYLLGYVPAKGLEVVRTTYDPYNDVDEDGDGDPHTIRTTILVPRNEVTLPELDEMIRAFPHCTGATCKSPDFEFKFGWKPGAGGLVLARIEVTERPPCPVP